MAKDHDDPLTKERLTQLTRDLEEQLRQLQQRASQLVEAAITRPLPPHSLHRAG